MRENFTEELREWMIAGEPNLAELHRKSGVSYTVLREIKSGKRKNVTDRTYSAIACAMFDSVPGTSCENCFHCLAFEPEQDLYGCEITCGQRSTGEGCMMHKPAEE